MQTSTIDNVNENLQDSIERLEYSLELKQLPVINEDLQDLKSKLDVFYNEYKDLEVTDENYQQAKKSRAFLNKLKSNLDDHKKAIKKDYMQAYDAMETKYKEATSSLDNLIKKIDWQIKDIEEARKEAKRKDIEDIIATELSLIAEDFLPIFNKINLFKDEYLNATYKATKVVEDIKAKIANVQTDINSLINLFPGQEQQIIMFYLEKQSVTYVMEKLNALKTAPTINRPEAAPATNTPYHKPEELPPQPQVPSTPQPQQTPVAPNGKDPLALMEGVIRVTGTRSQLNFAVTYLKQQGIKIQIIDRKEI